MLNPGSIQNYIIYVRLWNETESPSSVLILEGPLFVMMSVARIATRKNQFQKGWREMTH